MTASPTYTKVPLSFRVKKNKIPQAPSSNRASRKNKVFSFIGFRN